VRKTYAFTKLRTCVYFLVTQYGKFKILRLYNVEHTLLVTCEAIQEISQSGYTYFCTYSGADHQKLCKL